MTQRLYLDYEREERYYEEPKLQRQKASKMAEIESYVSILIDNNRAYGEELNILRKENTDLRGQIEVMMGEMLKLKESYEEIIVATKAQYGKEVGGLIDELKDILHKKEQMEGNYKSLLEELSYQCEYDKKARAQQLDEVERNFENKIRILNDRIQQQNKELQKNYYLNSDSKLRMVKEIDALHFEVSELRKENNDLQQGANYQMDEITRLSLTLKQLNKEKEEMGVNLLKIEQEKNHYIIELKQSGTIVREQLDTQIDNLKKMQVAMIAKEKDLQHLNDKYENTRRQKDQYEDYYHKLSAQLSEREIELSSLQGEYTRLNDYSSKEIKRLADMIKNLESQNSRLLKDKQELDSQLKVKQEEIYTLLERVQCLQSDMDRTNQNLLQIEDESSEIRKNEALLRDELQSIMLQHRNTQQKCQLQLNHIQTLEQIIEKEKRRNGFTEISLTDRELISKQQSNDLTRKYEMQIEELLRRHSIEKGEMSERFEGEKQRLIRIYEKALREKEMAFKEKITIMESEIRELALS